MKCQLKWKEKQEKEWNKNKKQFCLHFPFSLNYSKNENLRFNFIEAKMAKFYCVQFSSLNEKKRKTKVFFNSVKILSTISKNLRQRKKNFFNTRWLKKSNTFKSDFAAQVVVLLNEIFIFLCFSLVKRFVKREEKTWKDDKWSNLINLNVWYRKGHVYEMQGEGNYSVNRQSSNIWLPVRFHSSEAVGKVKDYDDFDRCCRGRV